MSVNSARQPEIIRAGEVGAATLRGGLGRNVGVGVVFKPRPCWQPQQPALRAFSMDDIYKAAVSHGPGDLGGMPRGQDNLRGTQFKVRGACYPGVGTLSP